jgi:hypothetical protein
MEEGALPSYSIAEVQAGFKAHPDSIRTEIQLLRKHSIESC